MRDLLATWLDVIDNVPQYFKFDSGEFEDTRLTSNRIISYLSKEESRIRTKLKTFYPVLSLGEYQDPNTYCLTQNTNLDFTFKKQHITTINLVSKVYKFRFTSTTEFIVTPDEEAPVVGNITTDLTLEDIIVKKEMWTGYIFVTDDTFYMTLTHYEEALVQLASKLAAAKLLEQTFASETSNTSGDAALLRQEVKQELNALTSTDGEARLEVSWNTLDISPIATGYDIDELGNDITEYEEDV
ncbi:MAG TPA: hypothetical protein VI815_03000 [Candidatus Nanoarchaeia archaeon]|nr:hypothetical protein [Candidatus Nanoarchaeia archaeon]